MIVIAKLRLREFWERYPDAESWLRTWHKIARKATWSDLKAVRQTYPSADGVTLESGNVVTVFNVSGNKYRMIVDLVFKSRRIYIKLILTHAEYNKNKWKATLCHPK